MLLAPGPVGVLVPEWGLIGIALGLIIARFYLRLKIQKRGLLVNDILMLIAWVGAAVSSSFDIILTRFGALEPTVSITFEGYQGTPEETTRLLEVFWLSVVPFWTALYLVKASLFSMYLQIFPHFMTKQRIFLWATIGYAAIGYITSILVLFLICRPVQRNWSLDWNTACSPTDQATPHRIAWGFHITTDILIFSLPWLIVPGLQMQRRLKTGVYCIFLLGLINIIFSIIRQVAIESISPNNFVPLSQIMLWQSLDANIGLVVACLPSLRPYFQSGKSAYRSQKDDIERIQPVDMALGNARIERLEKQPGTYAENSGGLMHITSLSSLGGDSHSGRSKGNGSDDGMLL